MSSSRNNQPYVPVMGKLFRSPKKRHTPDVHRAPVHQLGTAQMLDSLKAELLRLQASTSRQQAPEPCDLEPDDHADNLADLSDPMEDTSVPSPSTADSPSKLSSPKGSDEPSARRKRRRLAPEVESESLYGRWRDLLPTFVEPLLAYQKRAAGQPVATIFRPVHSCKNAACVRKMQPIILLFWDHFENIKVPFCTCQSFVHVLIKSGMFPTAPLQPRIAVSIDLLELYLALFERSGDTITALARALHNFYTKRGWRVLNGEGGPILDPFRKPIGHAVQWYDGLRTLVERHIETTVDQARSTIAAHLQSSDPLTEPSGGSSIPTTAPQPDTPAMQPDPPSQPEIPISDCPAPPYDFLRIPSPGRSECSFLLQRRCPACFGGGTFGRSFADGGDIVIALDGNFSHRHLRSAGDSPHFYDSEYFIPKARVDAVGEWIQQQRKKPPKKTYKSKVPDEAIDSCENGHEAADEQKAKTNGDRFDDTGIMAMICGHDIPIFLVNIDTPGEQQKYAFSLILELFAHLPLDATVSGLYDIGCSTDHSNGLYDLLPTWITERLQWAISVMHAYGHEWACQLVYNPRLRPGLGLRDGEGVERLWSRLRIFIPVTRTSGRSRRIWLIDRQAHAIGEEMRNNLGIYIARRLKNGVQVQYATAEALWLTTGESTDVLRKEWASQCAAQLSISAHAPARLKREVDAVLNLQAEIERVDHAITAIQSHFKEGNLSADAETIVARLRTSSAEISKCAESLYTSLNVTHMFPELKGMQADFVRVLILARDIKINIRKRVTAQFLEFDRLDRAAGGKDNPLGMKLHQYTRKAISKRQPAILTAIRKFNKYCVNLQQMVDKHNLPATILIPQQLSTNLAVLRDDPNLYEDVWVSPVAAQAVLRWLESSNVRSGIRAMLKMDRCLEEKRRLVREVENMRRWYGRELAATKLALRLIDNSIYLPHLQRRHDDIFLLQRLWDNPLATSTSFDNQVQWAESIVKEISPISEVSATITTSPLLRLIDNTDDLNDDDETLIESSGTDNPELEDLLDAFNDDNEFEDSDALASQSSLDTRISEHRVNNVLENPGSSTFEQEPNVTISEPQTPVANQSRRSEISADESADESAHISELHASQRPGPSMDPSVVIYHREHPNTLSKDPCEGLATTQVIAFTNRIPCPRVLQGSHSFPRVLITPDDYARLADDQAMLDGDCINACASLLQRDTARLPVRSCAVFSTYDAVLASNNNVEALERSVSRRRYGDRDIWIIPIHRPGVHTDIGHWTVVIADMAQQILYQFDSFGESAEWQRDVKIAWKLIQYLLAIVSFSVPSGPWNAYPVQIVPVQTNAIDCGVWVLAMIAARLRGFHSTALCEDDIPQFRRYLCSLITRLPEVVPL